MNKIYNIGSGLTKEALRIKAFSDLHDKYKEKTDFIMLYIYYMEDFNSPYFNYREEERFDKIKDQYLKDNKFKECELIKAARKEYVSFNTTPSLSLFLSAKKAIFQLQDYFNNIILTPGDDPKQLVSTLEKVGRIIESYSVLEEKVKKENSEKGRSRGNTKTGKYED